MDTVEELAVRLRDNGDDVDRYVNGHENTLTGDEDVVAALRVMALMADDLADIIEARQS